jgi:hypothetical protein
MTATDILRALGLADNAALMAIARQHMLAVDALHTAHESVHDALNVSPAHSFDPAAGFRGYTEERNAVARLSERAAKCEILVWTFHEAVAAVLGIELGEAATVIRGVAA